MTDLKVRDPDKWYKELDVRAVSTEVAVQVRLAADSIRKRLQRTAEEVIEIGRELDVVKQQLPHGRWGEWLSLEFSMSDRTAQRFIGVAQRFGDKSDTVSDLPARVLYALAAPSTPDVVVEAALDQVAEGKPVDEAGVQSLKRADVELKAESPLLHTHESNDVAQRAADTRAREQAVKAEAGRVAKKKAQRVATRPPAPLACPACESSALWVVKRSSVSRDKNYHLQCQECNHRWWSQHSDAGELKDRPELKMAPPPPIELESPTVIATIRIQPGEVLAERRCIVAVGPEGQMPQMASATFGQMMSVLAELLEEHVGRPELVGEFIEVEAA